MKNKKIEIGNKKNENKKMKIKKREKEKYEALVTWQSLHHITGPQKIPPKYPNTQTRACLRSFAANRPAAAALAALAAGGSA